MDIKTFLVELLVHIEKIELYKLLIFIENPLSNIWKYRISLIIVKLLYYKQLWKICSEIL